ncbi:MAG: flagellar basal body P-ring formation chaperone FlgA [Gammaproteobacteria bacterium]|nr:flagellar basal body P-ring formation chaperone FlgA [Gammaproteobacteria bacterium]
MFIDSNNLNYKLVISFILLILSFNVFANEFPLTVELKKKVNVTKQIIYLNDIAKLSTKGFFSKEKLQNIKIARSPRIGYVKRIKMQDIKILVRKQLPQTYESIKWTGAEHIQVHARGRTIAFDELVKQAKNYLITELNDDEREVFVNVTGKKKNINLPFGKVKFEPRLNSDFLSKRMCVWLDIYVEKQFYRSIPVWLNVEITEPVYVAKYTMQGKSTIVPALFEIKKRNVTDFSGLHVKFKDFKSVLLLQKKMVKNEVLLAKNVKKVPAVIGGRKVTVEVIEGKLRLKLQGVAQQDGEIGDIMKIKTFHSQEVIKAKVIGRQLVQVN